MANELEGIIKDAERLPWWAWAASGGVVLGVAIFVHNRQATAASVPIQADGNLPDGTSLFDFAGLPFGSDFGDPGSFQPPIPDTPTQVPVGDPGTPAPGPAPAPAPAPAPGPAPAPAPKPAPKPAPSGILADVPIGNWPAWNGSLSGIAAHYGKSLQQIEGFDGNRAMVFDHAHRHGHFGDEWDWVFSGEGEHIEVPA